MTRRKVTASEKLIHKITIRVSDSFFAKLHTWLASSNCTTVTQLARAILLKEKINWYHKNAELESVALQLGSIRKELNAIGRNINQITRHFHQESDTKKIYQASGASEEFRKVGAKVDQLLDVIATISKQWLPK